MLYKIFNTCVLLLLTNICVFTQASTINRQAFELLNEQTPGDTIRFAVLSDMHYGWEDNHNNDMITAIFDHIASLDPKPDFIIICGDAPENNIVILININDHFLKKLL